MDTLLPGGRLDIFVGHIAYIRICVVCEPKRIAPVRVKIKNRKAIEVIKTLENQG